MHAFLFFLISQGAGQKGTVGTAVFKGRTGLRKPHGNEFYVFYAKAALFEISCKELMEDGPFGTRDGFPFQ